MLKHKWASSTVYRKSEREIGILGIGDRAVTRIRSDLSKLFLRGLPMKCLAVFLGQMNVNNQKYETHPV